LTYTCQRRREGAGGVRVRTEERGAKGGKGENEEGERMRHFSMRDKRREPKMDREQARGRNKGEGSKYLQTISEACSRVWKSKILILSNS
jgi:hypothetical protein